MFATTILHTFTILIMMDGMSNQSLDRLEPHWVTGGMMTLRDQGVRHTIDYPEVDMVGDDAIHLLLSGSTDPNAPSLPDLMRIRHGYNSRTIVVAQDSTSAAVMGRHCADRIVWAANNDSVVDMAIELNRKYRLGQGMDHDVMMLQLSALSAKAASDILTSDADERAYYALNTTLGRLLRNIPPSNQVQYILIGIPHYGVGPDLMERVHMPLRTYDLDQVQALTNAYLMALHGHERWVLGIDGRVLRLNHSTIAKQSLDPMLVAQQAATFLTEFSAIRSAEMNERGDVQFDFEADYTPYWGSPFVTYPIITLPAKDIPVQHAQQLLHAL